MSQRTTRKRAKAVAAVTAAATAVPGTSSSSSPRKQDSDIAKYFDDCLTFVPDNDASRNRKRKKAATIHEDEEVEEQVAGKTNANSRVTGSKAKFASSGMPVKRYKSVLKENTSVNVEADCGSINRIKSREVTPTPLSIGNYKSQRSHASLRNVFDGVTQTSSKILSFQALDEADGEKRLELSSWGLPSVILEKYHARGVTKMFPWQVECLANKKILEDNKNLVYSAPTSAGKTLVAEFLLLKTVLERRKKIIFILPFVSVVREKMFYFQDLLSDSGVRVEGFMGGVAPAGGFSAVHVAIATIEKANSLINRLMEDGDLVTLGAVVIDELHLLGDPGRGYLLELLLTKLRYMTLNLEHVNIQLIGMSATLPNLPLIAEWLDAELYKTDFRPIPLQEQCKLGSFLHDTKLTKVRELEPAPDIVNDTDNIIQLCIETIKGGHGVLIFCPTKNWCEKLATQMASTFFQLGRDNKTPNGHTLRKNIDSTAVQEVLEQLKSCPVGLDSVLHKTVAFGVAFHHAGLTMDERDIIEGGFRVGSLKVLVATSTLSSGVNLPARRVIIRSPIFNGRTLDKLTYQQMIGRAGRMGKDTAGESILICKPNERTAAVNLMTSSLEPIVSCLEDSGPLVRALLEAIASQIVRTPEDLDFYSKCTFVYKCEDNGVRELVDEAVKFLISNEFLLVKSTDGNEKRMVATCLGKACLSASIPPRDGLFLFEELQRARKCFVLDTELHVIYLVTPFNSSSQISQIDWMSFMELWRLLPESERRVGQLVGVEERFLMTAMRGIVKPGKALNIHRRFYTALALHDLVREMPLNAVCRKYNCCRGLLQSLQQSSATFAGMVTNFCKELKWDCMELLFAQFQTRLQFGVCRDLLDLLRLPSLNGLRARSLFKHGIETVAELAVASELDVEEALNKALPFESEKDFDGENEAEVAKRTKMRTVFITGKDGLTAREAALIVIKEARVLIKNELGIRNVQWSQSDRDGNQSSRSPFSTTTSAVSLKHLSVSNILPLSRSPSFEVRSVRIEAVINNHNNDNNINRIDEEPPIMEVSESNNDVAPTSIKSRATKDSGNVTAASGDLNPTSSKPKSVDKAKSYPDQDQILFEDTSRSVAVEQKTPERTNKRVSEVSERLSTSCGDIVNESDKIEDASKTLRSKLAERTKSLMKEGHFTICTMDFEDKMDSPKQPAVEDKGKTAAATETNAQKDAKSQSRDSFQVSDRALSAMMKIAEAQVEDVFQVPAPVAATAAATTSAKPTEDKKRTSAGSNYSKSPSLFSDSSFLDAQVCSILEKNVLDLVDFEKSNFTPSSRPRNTSRSDMNRRTSTRSEGSIGHPSSSKQSTPVRATNTPKSTRSDKDSPACAAANVQPQQQLQESKMSMPMTWNEDSWDQTGFARPMMKAKENNVNDQRNSDKQSPSLLHSSRMRTRRPLATTQMTLSKIQAAIGKDQSPDSPKPVLRKRPLDKENRTTTTPPAIASGTSRKLAMPLAVAGTSNPSDSEESIASSQVTAKTSINKTRSRIEQKLMTTQKWVKSINSIKNSTAPKITREPSSKLLKRNAELFSQDSTTSTDEDNDSADSCLMFDSDDTVSSQPKKSKKIRGNRSSDQLLRWNSCASTWSSDEKIDPCSIEPINVANSKRTFKLFRKETERKTMAVALITEPYNKDPALTIGSKIVGTDDKKKSKKTETLVYGDRKLSGIIFCWGAKAIYYMPFGNTTETKVTIKERMSFLREILTDPTVSLRCFNAKEVYKMFYVCCDIESCCEFLDPITADWLMNSESVYKSYTEMAAQYFPSGIDVAKSCESNANAIGSMGSGRAIVKALLGWFITKVIMETLTEQSPTLLTAYREIEMPTIIILANMELRGFGINANALQELSTVMRNDLSRIEEKAFGLAGRKFNFSSTKEVSQVLGLNKKGRACTNKAALKSCENPISDLVTLWRKINSVLSKILFPLLHVDKKNGRLHGNCITHTVTGRVSMNEPNLQTIPRDFKSDISGCVYSARMAFVPATGNVMLSADFCQLELRILAHFSQDRILCNLFHQDGDIFKNIAARMNKITEEMVDDEMRQRAKQLCYAMIYGMGAKSLAQSLSVSESEAKDYLEAFMSTYREIRVWLNAVSEKARIDGYVATLMDRRRVLSGINSSIPGVKAQAERQAVNTKVQGSAADITKKAMVLIERRLREQFTDLPVTLPITQARRGLRSSDAESRPRGAYLILQLHDELLYEVNSNDVEIVAKIVKESMENAFKLSVPLPVKIKVGKAWGDLVEYKI